jgi:hypothetical protein
VAHEAQDLLKQWRFRAAQNPAYKPVIATTLKSVGRLHDEARRFNFAAAAYKGGQLARGKARRTSRQLTRVPTRRLFLAATTLKRSQIDSAGR